ncbi:uncharacterized protein [Physcomitrium patens]|uniref:OBERON-like protein n=1 Tax=Physcomitrium patens TaxID=3218 RepID=A0A2K1J893_PHYPA|nr:protein OBERON 4-like [Physcomitrium patens]PNR37755.1 hypothetical protein PHYPA_020864 [Physcomitrium patens]|eukprot:XP_024398364.1 protein OBERON 4-like [Physcomitrella patens]
MKRQGSYDEALVKVESAAGGGQEAAVASGKEGRHDTPRVKRRDGGSGSHGIERDFTKGVEDVRRRDSAVSGQRKSAIEREPDGKDDSSKARSSKGAATGSTATENGGQSHIGRLGTKSGSSKPTVPSGRDEKEGEEVDTNTQSSPIENENEGRKALVGTKRANVRREEDEAGLDKNREREEGELEPEVEASPDNGHKHEQAQDLVKEKTKENDVVEKSEHDRAEGLADEPMRIDKKDAPTTVNMEVSETEARIQVRESPEQQVTEPVAAQEVLEKAHWDLKLSVEQDQIETESKEFLDEGNSERLRRASVHDRDFTLGSSNEENPSRRESSEQAGTNPAGIFFMRLSGSGRDREEAKGEEKQVEKKQRVEDGAHLSLALPDTSLSLSSGDPRSRSYKQRRAHSHPSQQAPTQTYSRGFTESLSLSHSQPFHHNPSCSLTQTSMEKTELSSGSQQISVGKEQASYGSWRNSHGSQGNEAGLAAGGYDRRKSKPLYHTVLKNPQILQGALGSERSRGQGRERGYESVDNSQGSHQVPASDREMHATQSHDARRAMRREHKHKSRHVEAGEVWSSPSRSGDSREPQPHSKGERNSFGQREREVAGVDREFTSIEMQDIVSEPIPSMALKLQELPDSFLAGLKESLRDMLNSIEKREQFVQLQQALAARTDLTTDVLLLAHRIQLELLVAVKTGILAFLHSDIPMTHSALVEVFLQQRCRNFACQNQLPADECDCKLCAQKAGFCNSCMCVVCSKFDFDANTCRWIGCDFCLHWCHTDCGIRMSYITPGPSIRGAAGTTEMQFHCIACGHTSELYGFVKDVFCTCAPEWGRDVLARELDCVRRIFHGSTDTRGKQLCSKAEMILQQLNSQVDTAVACRSMIKFFDESAAYGSTSSQAQSTPLSVETKKLPSSSFDNKQTSTQTTLEIAKEALATYDSELEQKRQEASELQQERERKKAQIEELESIVRIKQAEAKMFALRADEARREAEGLHRIMLAKADKIEKEYDGKLSKLGIEDAEERCRKHHDTVQVLNQAQMDFHAMNFPLLNELHELLKQLEASKRHNWK